MVRATDALREMEDLPLVDLDAIVGRGPILVLAPHPDDESLGCGGLIAECCVRNREVHVAVLTDGAASHPHSVRYPPPQLAALRQKEARAAVAELGLPQAKLTFIGLPDSQSRSSGSRFLETIVQLSAHARAIGTRTICTTWLHDPHHDHLLAYRIASRVASAVGAKVLCFPVWGWTLPSTFWVPAAPIRGGRLDITHHLQAKRRAIACHRSQMTKLIEDDPAGFCATPEFLALFDRPFEVYLDGGNPADA